MSISGSIILEESNDNVTHILACFLCFNYDIKAKTEMKRVLKVLCLNSVFLFLFSKINFLLILRYYRKTLQRIIKEKRLLLTDVLVLSRKTHLENT